MQERSRRWIEMDLFDPFHPIFLCFSIIFNSFSLTFYLFLTIFDVIL